MQPKEKNRKTGFHQNFCASKDIKEKLESKKTASYEGKKYLQTIYLTRPEPRTQACLEDVAVPVQTTTTEGSVAMRRVAAFLLGGLSEPRHL